MEWSSRIRTIADKRWTSFQLKYELVLILVSGSSLVYMCFVCVFFFWLFKKKPEAALVWNSILMVAAIDRLKKTEYEIETVIINESKYQIDEI